MSPTIMADCVIQARKIGAITHLTFALTQPASYGSGEELQRDVCVRLAVPTDKATLIARTILAAITTKDWILPDEENTLDVAVH
jgi:hypothetical protein